MTAAALTTLFAVALALFLALRSMARAPAHDPRCRAPASVPPAFAERIGLAAHQKAADYTIARTRLGIVETLVEVAVLVVLTFGGGVAALVAWTGSVPVGALCRISHSSSRSRSSSGVIGLPFSYVQTFGIEAKFGFNRTTRALWVADVAKGVLIGAALGVPLAALVLWLMHAAGMLWWLWVWAAWIAFQLLILALYPTVIAPLFNKFSPLPPGPARATVEALLARCGFENRGLFVMDGSRRSSHGNAFFTGFGRAKRIVFFDTLLARLAPDEVEAVLAHELGHFRLKHVMKRMAWTAALSLAFLALLAWLAGSAMVLRRSRRAAGAGPAGCRAAPVLRRAARVHVRTRPPIVTVLAQTRVRSRRLRRAERVRHRDGARAREAVRGQCGDVDARPAAFGVL